MQKLSVVIITLNEEANIKACIESIKPIADEIVVVDSGSKDHTTEIAASLGAIVSQHSFQGYIEQKNHGLSLCHHPYILSLDADERLDELLLNEIQSQKQNSFPFDAYEFNRTTFIGDQPVLHGAWYPDRKIRLIKNGIGIWQGKGVHESLKINSTNIYTLKGNILHYSYKNFGELFEKTKKYANLAAEFLHKENKTISPIFIPIKASARFIKHYFLKLGFLSGSLGWQIGKQQFYEALWKYHQLHKLSRK